MIKITFVGIILLGLILGGLSAYYGKQLVDTQSTPLISRFAPLIKAGDPSPIPFTFNSTTPSD